MVRAFSFNFVVARTGADEAPDLYYVCKKRGGWRGEPGTQSHVSVVTIIGDQAANV